MNGAPHETKRRTGRFISFEGIDGCGKSTLMAHLGRLLDAAGVGRLATREPGATPLGKTLRSLVLDPANTAMAPWTELLLYAADRAQHVAQTIAPALDQGLWVLSDRFVDATLAYQGYARGLDTERLRALHEWTTGNIWPDCTVLLDCEVAVGFERRSGRAGRPDRLERLAQDFHERVRQGYLSLAASEPERFLVIDAGRSLPEVIEEFESRLESLGPGHPILSAKGGNP